MPGSFWPLPSSPNWQRLACVRFLGLSFNPWSRNSFGQGRIHYLGGVRQSAVVRPGRPLSRPLDGSITARAWSWPGTASLICLGGAGTVFMQSTWQMPCFGASWSGAGSAGCSMVMGAAVVTAGSWPGADSPWASRVRQMSAGQLIFTPAADASGHRPMAGVRRRCSSPC